MNNDDPKITPGNRDELAKALTKGVDGLGDLDLSSMGPEAQKELKALQEAGKALMDSMGVQPVIYDINEETGESKVVWLGPWQRGADAAEKSDAITKAKMAEHEKIGDKAFEDTLPLENALKPGEFRVR